MSGERFTLDANVLVYAFDNRDARKRALGTALLDAAINLDCPLALQAIGEFYSAATKKLKLSPAIVALDARRFVNTFETYSYSPRAIRSALDEASSGRFSFWDGVLLTSAAEAGCTSILSEDMQDGMRFGSLTVINPFGPKGFSDRARLLLEL